MDDFKGIYTACLASGAYKYIDKYYEINTTTKQPKIINVQLRYWIEAVEKFYNLKEEEYNEGTIEEGVLIINLLANSLLVLGGMNDKSGKERTPHLLSLYSGGAWDLKSEKADFYDELLKLNSDYNSLSKHMNKSRAEFLKDISFEKLRNYMDLVRNIWKWVLKKENANLDEVENLFGEPGYLLK